MPHNTGMKVAKIRLTFDSETLKPEQNGSGQARAQMQKRCPEKPPQLPHPAGGASGGTLLALSPCARALAFVGWSSAPRPVLLPTFGSGFYTSRDSVTLKWVGTLGENLAMCLDVWVPSLLT